MFTQTYHTDGIVPTSPSGGGGGLGKKKKKGVEGEGRKKRGKKRGKKRKGETAASGVTQAPLPRLFPAQQPVLDPPEPGSAQPPSRPAGAAALIPGS